MGRGKDLVRLAPETVGTEVFAVECDRFLRPEKRLGIRRLKRYLIP